jgi:hypothetical protein
MLRPQSARMPGLRLDETQIVSPMSPVSFVTYVSGSYPYPDARCPMPDARCPMPDARCPMPDARFEPRKIYSCPGHRIKALTLPAVDPPQAIQMT